jgi:hypothetical protein
MNKFEITRRTTTLGSSEVAILMKGDVEAIFKLYRQKIGEEPADDLSHVWPVQLGKCTERLNLDWYERTSSEMLFERGRIKIHPKHPWATCTLDAWDNALGCPVEAKHVGGREPIETIVDRYQPQCQWQMEITGAKQCALSIIMGANEPRIEYIERDAAYAAELLRRGEAFMQCVFNRTVPVVLPAVPPPIDPSKVYDYSQSETWMTWAAIWRQSYQAADSAKTAEKSLKAMVPADAIKVFGAGIRITRDKAGRLSLREDKT